MIERVCIWGNAVLCGRTTFDDENIQHFELDPWARFHSLQYLSGRNFDLTAPENRNADDPWSSFRTREKQPTPQNLCDMKQWVEYLHAQNTQYLIFLSENNLEAVHQISSDIWNLEITTKSPADSQKILLRTRMDYPSTQMIKPDLMHYKQQLKSLLQEIHAYAAKVNSPFTENFNRALFYLDYENMLEFSYPHYCLSLNALQLLHAVKKLNVWGGSGSWNDYVGQNEFDSKKLQSIIPTIKSAAINSSIFNYC